LVSDRRSRGLSRVGGKPRRPAGPTRTWHTSEWTKPTNSAACRRNLL